MGLMDQFCLIFLREKTFYTNIRRDDILRRLYDYNGLLSEMCLGCPLRLCFQNH